MLHFKTILAVLVVTTITVYLAVNKNNYATEKNCTNIYIVKNFHALC